MMNRITATFLILLIAATLALGIAWKQVEGLIAGDYTESGSVLLAVSGVILIFALFGLGRILYCTSPSFNTNRTQIEMEAKDV